MDKFVATKIILHCSDSPNGGPVGIKEITEWHKARGFASCGYHIVIKADGEIENGRGLNEIGAHCLGENHNSIGICLVGKDKFSRAQFRALHRKIEGILMTYPAIKPWEIYGHYQFKSAIEQGKTCPNLNMAKVWYWYHYESELAIKEYLMEGV